MGNIESSVKTASAVTTIKVTAPIFLENTECSINWQDSTFLKNSKNWRAVAKSDSGITVSNADGNSRGIDLKVGGGDSLYKRHTSSFKVMEIKYHCLASSITAILS